MRSRSHPSAQPSVPLPSSPSDKKEEELQIDWVTVSTNEEPEQDIAINWEDGTGEIIDGSTPAIVWEDVTNQLDLDIEVVEAEGGESSANIDMEANQIQESIEPENLAESMLAYAPIRNEFLDNIFELEAFLQQRIDDMSDVKGKAASMLDPMQLLLSQLQVDEELEIKQQMEHHTKDSVQKQWAAVNDIVQKFAAGGRLRQLIEIKSSGRYVDRLVGGLQQKQDLIDKSTAGVAAVQAKRGEIQEAIKGTQHILEGLLASSRALKRNIEMALSKVYNREITIVSPLL